MVPASFETFFLATAGAGGALIGLLFVAISIHPQRTFGKLAARGISDQQLAEATLLDVTQRLCHFGCALIPDINVG